MATTQATEAPPPPATEATTKATMAPPAETKATEAPAEETETVGVIGSDEDGSSFDAAKATMGTFVASLAVIGFV